MPTIPPKQLLDVLRWRYATKSFDPGKTIPEETWRALEESLVLTPSSYGLQPWKFLVITERPIREDLVSHAWGQRQVADCSHLVVMAARTGMTVEDIDRFLARTVEVRGGDLDRLSKFRDIMAGDLVDGPRAAAIREWAKNQAYIALGQFMLAAALVGVDTCPMEGFDASAWDKKLGLPPQGLTAAVVCPAGYRTSSDKYAALPKVRFRKDEVVVRHP